jgi:hypothetical protein
MKRRIEHARARCQKPHPAQKQQADDKTAEKQQAQQPAKTRTNTR